MARMADLGTGTRGQIDRPPIYCMLRFAYLFRNCIYLIINMN